MRVRRLQGEPGRTDALDDEERVGEVGCLVLDAVGRGVRRQRLDAEQNDRDERDGDRQQSDDEAGLRRLRILEQRPDHSQRRVGRKAHLVGRVPFRTSVALDRRLPTNNGDLCRIFYAECT